jgi:putative serine protease PepD
MRIFSLRTFSFIEVILLVILTAIISLSFATCVQRTQPPAALPPVAIADPSAASEEQNNVEIYRSMSPGVAHITTTVAVQGFFGVFPQQGTGSGSIIDNQGHILTNYHVVRDARRLDVTLADKVTYRATFVGADPDNDIAVIKINAPPDRLRVIPMGSSAELAVGQKALAIGNPFGLDRTLTTGVISGLDRPLETEDGQVIEKVIQTDASINPGNSGGPLLNKHGQIIGINAAIFSPTGASIGIGFAIPTDTAKKLFPALIAEGRVRKGYLGVTTAPLTPALAQEFGVAAKEGVIVVEVQTGGPAEMAGLRSLQGENQLGDIILSIDGQPLKDPGDLARAVSAHKPGDKVVIGSLRQGRQQRIEVMLGDRPGETSARPRRGLLDWLR